MIEIIAEIAQGFEGSPKLADLLVKGAIAADADSIKFQLIYADELATPDYTHYTLFKSLEMDEEIWRKIADEIQSHQKRLYFDIYGDRSWAAAKRLRADGVKISSTEFYNEPLLAKALETFERIYISIGGIPVEDIDSLAAKIASSAEKICLMYGFQSEPTPLSQSHLGKIAALQKRYPQFKIGFMDHSAGDEEDALFLPILALGFDISCLEKHITLDRLLKIEDYVSGIEPEKFKEFVRLMRKFEQALGRSTLELTEAEIAYRQKAGKVVVASRHLRSGEILRREDLALKRVGSKSSGTEIKRIQQALGKKTRKDVPANAAIREEDLCEN